MWGIDRFDIYTVGRDGKDLQRLTNYGVYTAEGVLSPDGKRIVFTSLKDGDLDIYTMNVDGTDVKQLTTTPGYDGGPWWSPDGTKIVYRAYHPTDSAELQVYRELLGQRMIRPNRMELFVMNADGSEPDADHDARRRKLRPVVDAGRSAHHLLVEPRESAQRQFRSLSRQSRRKRADAGDHQSGVRRLSRCSAPTGPS